MLKNNSCRGERQGIGAAERVPHRFSISALAEMVVAKGTRSWFPHLTPSWSDAKSSNSADGRLCGRCSFPAVTVQYPTICVLAVARGLSDCAEQAKIGRKDSLSDYYKHYAFACKLRVRIPMNLPYFR